MCAGKCARTFCTNGTALFAQAASPRRSQKPAINFGSAKAAISGRWHGFNPLRV
jgi:hypothetical protein